MSIKAVLLLAGVLVVSVAFSQSAFAHSRPVRFDPPPGAVLESAPAAITGWYTSPLRRDTNWTFMHVTDSKGTRVDTGEATLSSDRKQMSVMLQPNLPAGRYVVNHRGWDDEDGEIVGDCFTFFVGQAAADAAVQENFRLDGGADCDRFEASTRNGTPVPGSTPVASEEPEAAHADETEGGSGSGVATWLLAVTGVIGLVVGGIGSRLVGRA